MHINNILKIFRKAYLIYKKDNDKFGRNWRPFSIKSYANQLITKAILSNKPFMVARFGSTELSALVHYKHSIKKKEKSIINFIKGTLPQWWYENIYLDQLCTKSGFFPNDLSLLNSFYDIYVEDIKQIDLLASWLLEERFFNYELKNCKRVVLEDIEPFFVDKPWTHALRNKRVLVIHPFEESIKYCYSIKDKIFPDGLLPEFELKTLKAVQTIAGEKSKFINWFEALDYMKNEMDKIDFDVAIIGAGAYGLPLAAYAKKIGKIGVHLAGITQMLFGIKGSRWENYIVYPYSNLINEFWVRPNRNETPSLAKKIEGGCYW